MYDSGYQIYCIGMYDSGYQIYCIGMYDSGYQICCTWPKLKPGFKVPVHRITCRK